MSARQLVVARYFQYARIAVGLVLRVFFARRISGVLLTFAMLSATALYGIVGVLFAVPVIAIVSATLRCLRQALVFERWRDSLLKPASAFAGEPEKVGKEEDGEESQT